jgi:hypothetical protein
MWTCSVVWEEITSTINWKDTNYVVPFSSRFVYFLSCYQKSEQRNKQQI